MKSITTSSGIRVLIVTLGVVMQSQAAFAGGSAGYDWIGSKLLNSESVAADQIPGILSVEAEVYPGNGASPHLTSEVIQATYTSSGSGDPLIEKLGPALPHPLRTGPDGRAILPLQEFKYGFLQDPSRVKERIEELRTIYSQRNLLNIGATRSREVYCVQDGVDGSSTVFVQDSHILTFNYQNDVAIKNHRNVPNQSFSLPGSCQANESVLRQVLEQGHT